MFELASSGERINRPLPPSDSVNRNVVHSHLLDRRLLPICRPLRPGLFMLQLPLSSEGPPQASSHRPRAPLLALASPLARPSGAILQARPAASSSDQPLSSPPVAVALVVAVAVDVFAVVVGLSSGGSTFSSSLWQPVAAAHCTAPSLSRASLLLVVKMFSRPRPDIDSPGPPVARSRVAAVIVGWIRRLAVEGERGKHFARCAILTKPIRPVSRSLSFRLTLRASSSSASSSTFFRFDSRLASLSPPAASSLAAKLTVSQSSGNGGACARRAPNPTRTVKLLRNQTTLRAPPVCENPN